MILALLLSMTSLLSCRARVVPPIEVHHYHTNDSIRVERDTIKQVDTVRIERRNDTVYIDKIRYVDRVREVTLKTQKADSVPLPPLPAMPAPEERKPPITHTAFFALIACFALALLLIRQIINLKNLFK